MLYIGRYTVNKEILSAPKSISQIILDYVILI